MAELDTAKFEEIYFRRIRYMNIAFWTHLILSVATRVRHICRQECERYGTTWACPPAVGTLKACEDRIHSYGRAVFFSQRSRGFTIL